MLSELLIQIAINSFISGIFAFSFVIPVIYFNRGENVVEEVFLSGVVGALVLIFTAVIAMVIFKLVVR